MSQYKHFSYEERVELARMYHQGASKAAIGTQLDRPRSSIEREIARNEPPRVYRRVIGSNLKLLFVWFSSLHNNFPLLHWA